MIMISGKTVLQAHCRFRKALNYEQLTNLTLRFRLLRLLRLGGLTLVLLIVRITDGKEVLIC